MSPAELLNFSLTTFEDRRRISTAHRLLAQADRSGECWLWLGCKMPKGYGTIGYRGRTVLAHRLSYELFVGPIEPGQVIDHIVCDNPPCVRPDHLRATTQAKNVQRAKTKRQLEYCFRGHSYNDPTNVYVSPNGHRLCKACRRVRYLDRLEENRALSRASYQRHRKKRIAYVRDYKRRMRAKSL